MRKFTFIILFLGIVSLLGYFYLEQGKIITDIENTSATASELVLYTPREEVSVEEVFMNKPNVDINISETQMITVGSEYVECTGVAPMGCLLVDGQLFYDSIVGFDYQPGYIYRLEVDQIFREEPIPADAASWYYSLVKVVSKDLPFSDDILIAYTWIWKSYTEDNVSLEPKQTDVFTINFDGDGRVSGTTDCNNYFGTYSLAESLLDFGPLATTLMACPDSQEGLYHNLLSMVNAYRISDNMLVLEGDNGFVMEFIQETEKAL